MKNPPKFNPFFFVLALGLSVIITSCKKETVTPSTPTTPENTNFDYIFKADVDGVPFDVQTIGWSHEILDSTITIGGQTDTVGAAPDSTYFLYFKMPSTILPGTYSFDGTEITAFYQLGIEDSSKYSPAPNTGTLVISTHDFTTHVIEGTFSFTAIPVSGNSNTNSYSITNGMFSIKFDE